MFRKKLLYVFLSAALAFAFQSVFAQNRTITGKVTDAKDGKGIPGASVIAKGTNSGTSTSADGSFRLSVPASATVLSVSSVGYQNQDVPINDQSVIDISMAVFQGADLNEVVVTGYGTTRKRDLTGAVTSVKAKDFNKGVQVSPDQLIQGKVAGVQVVTNSGQPGGATTIRIRGASSIRAGNTPLFVIDGVPLSNTNSRPDINLTNAGGGSPAGNPFNFINPSDIASIDVLKDASAAAIYGSRGANGVVLITTKRGQSGTPKLDVNSSFGISNVLRKIDVLSADEYRQALTANGFSSATNAVNGPNYGGTANAWDEITQPGGMQNYSVALSGGNENAKYRASFGYMDQKGIVRKTDFKKYTSGLNSSFRFLESKKLGLDFNILASHTLENVAPISNTAGFQGSLIGQALIWNPTRAMKYANGAPIIDFTTDAVINPLAYSEAYFDKPKVTTILATIAPSYKITKDLEYKTQVSVTYSVGSRKQYTTSNINFNDLKKAYNATFNDTIGGEANVAQNELLTSQITNTLSYNKQISSALSLSAVVGHEYQMIKFSGNSMYARGFLRTDKPYYYYMSNSDPQTRRVNGFADPEQELQSFFGRAILNFKDKYLVTATLRADGSSKFGKNNRYGYFPSLAAAWNISREAFLSDFTAVENIKLRAGWGITGNQEFPAGASQQTYSLTGNDARQNFSRTQIENPDLQWEQTRSINIGLDFTMLHNKLAASIDYFNRNTSDILFAVDAAAPGPSGALKWVNLPGNIINSGLEISLNGNAYQNKNLSIDLGLNVSFLHNELKNSKLFLPTGEINGQGLSGAFSQVITDNQPVNVFYLKRFLGIDKTTGVAIYDEGDKKFFAGTPNPKMLIGFSPSIKYKKLSLDMSFNGAFGHYVYNNTTNAALSFNNLGKRNLSMKEYQYGLANGEKTVNPTSASTRYLEKGDFLKLANTTLAYSLGNLGKDIKGVTLFVTAQNLFVITNYSGFDPEVNTSKPLNGVPSFGIEYMPYPSARTINFGFNFSL